MKLLLAALLLLASLYVYAHPVEAEHGGYDDANHHLSKQVGKEIPAESDEDIIAEHDPEPDVDPLDEEMPEDFRLEELNEEEKMKVEQDSKMEENKEEDNSAATEAVLEEKSKRKKLSLKDHAQLDHKIEKRGTGKLDHGHGHRLSDRHRDIHRRERRSAEDSSNEHAPLRHRRSIESEEDKTEEMMGAHAERKRRDTSEQHIVKERSSSEEHSMVKRGVEQTAPSEAEGPAIPAFESDGVEQVDSVAIRVKRVSRAGSSHKVRVMNKNKSNTRAGQAETGVEPE